MDAELDNLITYIEKDLIGENSDMQFIDEGIKRYAELWHKKMNKKIKNDIMISIKRSSDFDKSEARIIINRFL